MIYVRFMIFVISVRFMILLRFMIFVKLMTFLRFMIFVKFMIFLRYVPIIGLCCPGPSPVLGGTLSRVWALSFSPFQRYSSNPYLHIFLKNISQEYPCKDILERKYSNICVTNFASLLFHLDTLNKRIRRKDAVLQNWLQKNIATSYFQKNIATSYFQRFPHLKFTTKLSATKIVLLQGSIFGSNLWWGQLVHKYMGTVQTNIWELYRQIFVK